MVGLRAGLNGRKISYHRDSTPDRPARSQSLYRLSYPAHCLNTVTELNYVADPMEQSPCVGTIISAASARDSRNLLNPNVQFPVRKSPPPGPVVSQINPVHVPPPFPLPNPISLKDPLYYSPPIYAQVFQVVCLPQVSSRKRCIHLVSPLCVPHVSANSLLKFHPHFSSKPRA